MPLTNLSLLFFQNLRDVYFSLHKLTIYYFRYNFDSIQESCSRMEAGAKRSRLAKICHTYPAMMKLGTIMPYLRKIQKIYESRDTTICFCRHQHFFTRNHKILPYQEIQILISFWCIISNSFNFSWVFKKIALINMVTILMMSAKMAMLGFLKIKLLWIKGYDVITSVYVDVTNKILSRDLNYML